MTNNAGAGARPDQTDDGEGEGYLPFEFLADFLSLVAQPCSNTRTMHYGDLDWGASFSLEQMYSLEWAAWNRAQEASTNSGAFILLQFDLDFCPERGMAVLRLLKGSQLRASVMLFNKRINRKLLREKGKVEFTSYDVNSELLQSLQQSDQVSVGYHSNAMEQAKWSPEKALAIFENDIGELRASYGNVVTFSPHGGVAGPSGENNTDIPVTTSIQEKLSIRWVHNKRAPNFHSAFSDGGFTNTARHAGRLNLTAFTRSLRPATRSRVLIHPQYYSLPGQDVNVEQVPLHVLSDPWYQQVLGHYRPEQLSWALERRLGGLSKSKTIPGPWDGFTGRSLPSRQPTFALLSKIYRRMRTSIKRKGSCKDMSKSGNTQWLRVSHMKRLKWW